MKRELVAQSKWEFEINRENWKAFGVDLVVGTPCAQSPMARKALHGHWQEALQDYFKIADFSDHAEETMVGFILATEVTFHRRSPAPIPELPERVWDEKSLQKALRWFAEDVAFWHKWIGNKDKTGNSEYFVNRNTFAQLLRDNKPVEAEAYFFKHGMNRLSCAEIDLAAARMCSHIHGTKAESKRAATTMWFFADGSKRSRGPISEVEMQKAFDSGQLLRSTFVWTESMNCWQQATELACFQIGAYCGKLPPPME
jgi:hypothetical protein